MGTRTMWAGALGVGLINIPVKLSKATGDDSLPLHMVRKSDGSRIQFKRVAAADGEEVAWGDIAKSYTTPGGDVVVLSDEDFEAAYGKNSRVGEIIMFTEAARVPRIAAGSSYFVHPAPGGEKTYTMLAQALARQGKVAILRLAFRQRENLAVLYPAEDGYLVLEALQWSDDVRKPSFAAPDARITDAEAKLADQLITAMSGHFDFDDYHDESETKLAAIVQQRIETGRVIVGAAVTQDPRTGADQATDLMGVLKSAVTDAKKARQPAKPRTTRRKASA